MPLPESSCESCPSRRDFLAATGTVAVATVLGQVFPGRVQADDAERPARLTSFDRVRVAALSNLEVGQSLEIAYPPGVVMNEATLYRLGTPAGGGGGPGNDVVAFSAYCTHMGGDLRGAFDAGRAVVGPCPEHLTTFDLTRHGMVVAGHAVQPLPQLVLEVDGDDVFATGVVGLLYGHHAVKSQGQNDKPQTNPKTEAPNGSP